MNCRDAQFYLRLRRESADELGPDVAGDLDRHLDGCPDCAAESAAERSFDHALGSAMRAVVVPAALRARLVANLSAHRGTQLRRQMFRSAAMAASVFLTMGLAFGAFSAARPRLDATELVNGTDFKLQNPEEATRLWLASQKLPTELPRPFDFDLFVTYGTEPVQGRDVPVVTFRERGQGPGLAKVYIFHAGRFDLRGVPGEVQASHSRALVIDDQKQHRGVVYVVVFTGPSLDPFLKARGGQTAGA